MKSNLVCDGKFTGKRKSARVLSTRESISITLKSDEVVRISTAGFYKHRKQIEKLIHETAAKFGCRIYELAVGRDHIHILILVSHRLAYRSFIQIVSAAIRILYVGQFESKTGVLGSNLNPSPKPFWSSRPHTRVVPWGLAFKRAKSYIMMNRDEFFGEIPYQPRGPGSLEKRKIMNEPYWPSFDEFQAAVAHAK